MGLLIDGVWHDDSHDTKPMQGGRFVRGETRYRNWVTSDGLAGPTCTGGSPAARGRYHLYVALSCPWAHRTGIVPLGPELDFDAPHDRWRFAV